MTQTHLPGYLVTRRLATRMRPGARLTAGQPVDTLHAWRVCRHAECGCLARIRIAHAATTLAQGIDHVAVMRGGGDHPGKRARLDVHSLGLRAPCARRDTLLPHLDGNREVSTR
ncbi:MULTISPECIES: hypothetical protein [Burkholderia]|uniref:Uncharacterized protein n=1 Tax=Burkholderia contaminans TaxID=488447 RepID=A0A2S5DQH9_9BURK|nr:MULTISPECIES: hypothetical protein [Burkholderia]EKS9797957.1 hypothetical protein [Burkholderia cepacia]EKS9805019.1 hypothetical protein [Burkholderia cepacia]EKS9816012.1 hypothetical protein [Burkholderia cepacia]EKS9822742.1 hypothetical protein [Burkholderia cepacia]EKS9830259.1 hypothetical protein [Burkholderia cepacia]